MNSESAAKRFPGIILGVDQPPFPPLLKRVANQLKVGIESWDEHGQREQTRREHLVELETVFGFQPFTMSHYRQAVHTLPIMSIGIEKNAFVKVDQGVSSFFSNE